MTWRAQAKWRNGDGFNVSFHPKGIKDYGDGDRGMSAIDVVMAALDMDFGDAVDWLKGKLGIKDLPRLHLEFRKPGEAEPVGEMESAADLVTNAISSVANLLDQAGEIVTADMRVSEARDVATFVVSNKPDPLAVFEPWVGVDWTRPGGDLGLLADYFEASGSMAQQGACRSRRPVSHFRAVWPPSVRADWNLAECLHRSRSRDGRRQG